MSELTYTQIPKELRDAPQWCIAGPDKAPYYLAGKSVLNASPINSKTWTEFEKVVQQKEACSAPGIGFVLRAEDPWTCIDIDICNAETQRLKGKPIDKTQWTTQEQTDRYLQICKSFDSYTEVSTLGWGIHIWVRGCVGAGVKRDGVEVYSQERFMICTGNVFIDKPIAERQDMLDNMVSQMRSNGYNGPVHLVEVEEVETDMSIYETASKAANAVKFDLLMSGNWRGSYPSQSEADLALMSMLAFYSKSNEQCRRLFRSSPLSHREKATKNNKYLDYTLEVIRGRQQREELIASDAADQAREFARSLQSASFANVASGNMVLGEPSLPNAKGSIPWPPGKTGLIAQFIYNSSIRPVQEVAIVAALGFMAGVCGKAFNLPQSGLNMYIVLVAQSAIGKEALHSGISLIAQEVGSSSHFLDFNEYVSSPALLKALSVQQSMLNISGEFGKRLKRFAEDNNGDTNMAQLRTMMTNLYQKSSLGSSVGGLGYSDKDKNVASMTGISYSMIGESTPETFYQALTATMMEDGFLSRFLIVDYKGLRPSRNLHPIKKMDPGLVADLDGLCICASNLITKGVVTEVNYSPLALEKLDAFDIECDTEINSTDQESRRQMWNRAHLKVCRIAALLAVANNHIAPVIEMADVDWALDVVQRDIALMSSRLDNGEVGVDDNARHRKAASVLRDYIVNGAKCDSYGQPKDLHKCHIVSKRYIYSKLSATSQFRSTKDGSSRAIDSALKTLIDNGYLAPVDKIELAAKHSYHGIAYRIVALPPLLA